MDESIDLRDDLNLIGCAWQLSLNKCLLMPQITGNPPRRINHLQGANSWGFLKGIA